MSLVSSIYWPLGRWIVLVLTVGCALFISSSDSCWALPANGYPSSPFSPSAAYSSPAPKSAPAPMSTTGEDNTPCKEFPSCQEYFVLCGKGGDSGQLRRLDEAGTECLLTIDRLTCDHLKKLKKLPGEADLEPVGPLTDDEVRDIFQPLLPPKPLNTLGAWDIDRYCLYVNHEIGAHGSAKSCPNCKEEGEAWESQRQCLRDKYRTYCPESGALSEGCKLLQDAINQAKSVIDFQLCLCKQTTSCELCHKTCVGSGALPEWCDALKSTYCEKQAGTIATTPVAQPE